MTSDIQKIIDDAWENPEGIGPETTGSVRDAVNQALEMLELWTCARGRKAGRCVAC